MSEQMEKAIEAALEKQLSSRLHGPDGGVSIFWNELPKMAREIAAALPTPSEGGRVTEDVMLLDDKQQRRSVFDIAREIIADGDSFGTKARHPTTTLTRNVIERLLNCALSPPPEPQGWRERALKIIADEEALSERDDKGNIQLYASRLIRITTAQQIIGLKPMSNPLPSPPAPAEKGESQP